ncbi:MAG TPA: hypothetical protein VFU20_08945 [Sphingomicrobium sp.]|nr:hypothetical protein [Sphingomicrobium sp.]
MLNFVSVPQADDPPEPYAEALARLASIRHALRLVDPFGGGPASDPSEDDAIAAAWTGAGKAAARCFDGRTARTAGAAAAGLEALVRERSAGRDPNEAASRELAEEIRRGLEDISHLMRG